MSEVRAHARTRIRTHIQQLSYDTIKNPYASLCDFFTSSF